MTAIDDSLSEIRSVRNGIWRCRKLLQVDLPDAERETIEKRLLERRLAFERLLAATSCAWRRRRLQRPEIRHRHAREIPATSAAKLKRSGSLKFKDQFPMVNEGALSEACVIVRYAPELAV